jgi:mRNA interferase YafQ
MREIRQTTQFKKCLKRAQKNPRYDVTKLREVITILAEQGSLPDDYKPHPLIGKWMPSWECHVQPDFLLIYDVFPDILKLSACGSHSDLFG